MGPEVQRFMGEVARFADGDADAPDLDRALSSVGPYPLAAALEELRAASDPIWSLSGAQAVLLRLMQDQGRTLSGAIAEEAGDRLAAASAAEVKERGGASRMLFGAYVSLLQDVLTVALHLELHHCPTETDATHASTDARH